MIKEIKGDLLTVNAFEDKQGSLLQAHDVLLQYKNILRDDIYKNGIYKIYFKQKPEYLYIGMASMVGKYNSTCGFYIRWRNHLNQFDKNKHYNKFLQNMYNKFGFKSIVFEILEICESENCADREIFWIKKIKPATNYYGVKGIIKDRIIPESIKNSGRKSGWTHSEETKKKMSKSRRNIVIKKKILSDEKIEIVISLLDNGSTMSEIEKTIKSKLLTIKHSIHVKFGEEYLNKFILKIKENATAKIIRINKCRKINLIEKYKDIIPKIKHMYRTGFIISQISPVVGINDDLVGRIIKEIFQKKELSSIRSVNAIRRY